MPHVAQKAQLAVCEPERVSHSLPGCRHFTHKHVATVFERFLERHGRVTIGHPHQCVVEGLRVNGRRKVRDMFMARSLQRLCVAKDRSPDHPHNEHPPHKRHTPLLKEAIGSDSAHLFHGNVGAKFWQMQRKQVVLTQCAAAMMTVVKQQCKCQSLTYCAKHTFSASKVCIEQPEPVSNNEMKVPLVGVCRERYPAHAHRVLNVGYAATPELVEETIVESYGVLGMKRVARQLFQ